MYVIVPFPSLNKRLPSTTILLLPKTGWPSVVQNDRIVQVSSDHSDDYPPVFRILSIALATCLL
jgi:hypothetical protein